MAMAIDVGQNVQGYTHLYTNKSIVVFVKRHRPREYTLTIHHMCCVDVCRCEDFDTAWHALFKFRWPFHANTGHDNLVTVDWQQQYWEAHLQECVIKQV
jgi:hypothetical protein